MPKQSKEEKRLEYIAVAKLRFQGHSYSEIAGKLGISTAKVSKIVSALKHDSQISFLPAIQETVAIKLGEINYLKKLNHYLIAETLGADSEGKAADIARLSGVIARLLELEWKITSEFGGKNLEEANPLLVGLTPDDLMEFYEFRGKQLAAKKNSLSNGDRN